MAKTKKLAKCLKQKWHIRNGAKFHVLYIVAFYPILGWETAYGSNLAFESRNGDVHFPPFALLIEDR